MKMKHALVIPHAVATIVSVALISSVSAAEALPKSGTINLHSGYMAPGDMFTMAEKPEKRVAGHGANHGISFNDKGAGPMHVGPTDCVYTFYLINDTSKNKGWCMFGDADGDRMFTETNGTGTADGSYQGSHDIQGGTGKYAGISGTGAWKCRYTGANTEFACTQHFDYKLP